MLRSMVGEDARRRLGAWAASLAVTCAVASYWPVLAVDNAPIPNFAPDSRAGWLKPPGDEWFERESAPGPLHADPAHPYIPNSFPFVSREAAAQETVMIADLTNPILQP